MGPRIHANATVHPFDLPVTRANSPSDRLLVLAVPWVVWLGQPMLDLIRLTDHVEAKQKKSANTS